MCHLNSIWIELLLGGRTFARQITFSNLYFHRGRASINRVLDQLLQSIDRAHNYLVDDSFCSRHLDQVPVSLVSWFERPRRHFTDPNLPKDDFKWVFLSHFLPQVKLYVSNCHRSWRQTPRLRIKSRLKRTRLRWIGFGPGRKRLDWDLRERLLNLRNVDVKFGFAQVRQARSRRSRTFSSLSFLSRAWSLFKAVTSEFTS